MNELISAERAIEISKSHDITELAINEVNNFIYNEAQKGLTTALVPIRALVSEYSDDYGRVLSITITEKIVDDVVKRLKESGFRVQLTNTFSTYDICDGAIFIDWGIQYSVPNIPDHLL